MTTAIAEPRRARPSRVIEPFVDCDVHNAMPGPRAMTGYLAPRWQEQLERQKGQAHLASAVTVARGGGRVIGSLFHSRPRKGTMRWDSTPPTGGMPGSDLPFLTQDYLDMWPVERCILAPLDGNSWPQHGEFATALCSALNDWNAAEWLPKDDRLYGAIIVPAEDAVRAAAEVRRCAPDGHFVQVLMPARTRDPLGHTRYWPLYEAASEAGLPIALHVGGTGNAPSGAGWPSYHFEYHAGYHHSFQAQVVSLVSSGVFDRYPDVKFVMEEGGFLWAAPLAWRLDRAWRQMGIGHARVSRRPSELIREHFWFTTQPMDEAETPEQFLQALRALDDLGLADRVMFATDYPHWDFDAPGEAIPAIVPHDLRDRIFRSNAMALYRFGKAA